MKKIIAITLTLALVLTAFAGCGAKKTDAPKQEAPKTEAKKEEPKAAETVKYKDGNYEGVGTGMHEIKVSVEVKDSKIAKVTITKHEETANIAKPAIEQIPALIVEKNTPEVDVVSGATLASEGIINAVKNALEAAK